ncbi:MAG: undecaprenyl/decaprenyl-phosphate alpha-N-acetylglucosaminyl 1-phosphate transferase [Acidimicrobiia bacterium]|nr:undecaprenyl/decaprenyl-phosphate alpha-N-acetylglucosaminyl 1-phosphate transferase [Acidimicrobiia bacterium]
MPTLSAYAVVLLCAIATTALVTPLVRRLAVRVGAVAQPDERRVHERPTPQLGGIAMLAGVAVGMAVAWQMEVFSPVFSGTTEPLGLLAAAAVILAVGVIDDVIEVSAPAKVAGTVLAASLLVMAGISILNFRIPFAGIVVLSPDFSYLVTVLWVLGMTQAVNLIDGLDGLAAGIVAIASGTFFLYSIRLADEGLLLPSTLAPLVAVLVLGACVGFLFHNVHPARIFMGDGGALLLGLLMAASTAMVGGRTDQEFSGQAYFFFAPLFIPVLILGVPILDTLWAIIRRATKRQGVATADKDHLHHRLMRLGHGHRRSVLILWAWTALLSAFVLYPTYSGRGDALVPFGIAALGLLLYTVLHPSARELRKGDNGDNGDVDGEPIDEQSLDGHADRSGDQSV